MQYTSHRSVSIKETNLKPEVVNIGQNETVPFAKKRRRKAEKRQY